MDTNTRSGGIFMVKFRVAVLVTLLVFSFGISAFGQEIFAVRSVIAPTQPPAQCSISVTAGEVLELTASDLERRLGLSAGELGGITVTGLPPRSQGALYLDGVEVEAYEFLDRQAVDRLCFVHGEEATDVCVTFLPQSREAVPTNLSVQILASPNQPPVIEDLGIETSRNVAKKGAVSAYDPEGGPLGIQVISKPRKGEVTFDGLLFTYTPFRDMSGTDTFTVCAIDKASAYSREATVNVTIEAPGGGFVYADMASSPSAYAALKLQGVGVYTGEKIGGRYYFHPEDEITRGEFLVWLISAAGLEDTVQPTVNTGLPNDAGIPGWLKPYVAAGIKAGIIADGQSFRYLEVPIRSEAVLLTDLAADINDVKDYTLTMPDSSLIPDWALPSYKDLAAYRMLDLHDGYADPGGALTNSYAADLAWQLYKHCHR